MVAIPFSLVGILPAQGLMGAFFTATSMIGFMAGARIVLRNSIILVDFIEQRVAEGMPRLARDRSRFLSCESCQSARSWLGRCVGIGMVLYGYCPGTGVAAIATGSLHALVGFAGMVIGGRLYAFTYPWVEANIQTVGALGKVRLPELTGLSDAGWFGFLAAVAGGVFWLLEKGYGRARVAQGNTRAARFDS